MEIFRQDTDRGAGDRLGNPLINIIMQTTLVLLIAPLTTGIIKKLKAFIQHRKGAPILQTYYDIYKLFKKEMVVSSNASWIFHAAPFVVFATALAAAIMIPAIPSLFSIGFAGDIILLVYLLALGRFFLTLSALDTGSTFGGMGSSRELMISSLMEPALIILLFTSALKSGGVSTAITSLFPDTVSVEGIYFIPTNLLCFAALMIIILAETARIPIDDPSTHLELTMVHEAMLLEYSGRYLALVEYGSVIKQLLLVTLAANIFLPSSDSILSVLLPAGLQYSSFLFVIAGLVIYLIKVIFLTLLIGLIEINTVKLRLFSIPNLAVLSLILALLGFMTAFVFGR